MAEEREPNIREDAREQEQSTEGYPETDPTAGSGPASAEGKADDKTEEVPTNNPSGGHRDSPPSKATGNPNAAGP
jgi:hypothetical protein